MYLKYTQGATFLLEIDLNSVLPGEVIIISKQRIAMAGICKQVNQEPCDCIINKGSFMTTRFSSDGAVTEGVQLLTLTDQRVKDELHMNTPDEFFVEKELNGDYTVYLPIKEKSSSNSVVRNLGFFN